MHTPKARNILAQIVLGWAIRIGDSTFSEWLLNDLPREARALPGTDKENPR